MKFPTARLSHSLVACAAMLVLPVNAFSDPHLVKDLDTDGAVSGARAVARVGTDVLFLSATGAGDRVNLWTTDGTNGGTNEIAIVDPPHDDWDAFQFTESAGTLFFVNAPDGIPELWKTDGTESGTVRVATPPTQDNFSLGELADVGGTLFFACRSTYASGYDLWKSDGTGAGTVMVADIDLKYFGRQIADVGGIAYFAANDATGTELWSSDGTTAARVADINPGAASSDPYAFAALNGLLYFLADEPSGGRELWVSDGTAAGTSRVVDILPGAVGGAVGGLLSTNGKLYLAGYLPVTGSTLWTSDGTEAGSMSLGSYIPQSMIGVGSTVFFTAQDNTNGRELWKSDGTAAGTVLVSDISAGSSGSFPSQMHGFDGSLYFSATSGSTGRELWKSDGTAAGTVVVKDITPGSANTSPGHLVDNDDLLFFSAQGELWTSNGTAGGTSTLIDLLPPPAASADLEMLTATAGRLAFRSNVYPDWGLWLSDGSASGTQKINPTLFPGFLRDWNGTLIIKDADDGALRTRTPSGTMVEIYPAAVSDAAGFGDSLYFSDYDSVFVSDGTAEGEVTLITLPRIMGFPSAPRHFVDLGTGIVLFRAMTTSFTLWRTDGTPGGTSGVANIGLDEYLPPKSGDVLAGKYVFLSSDTRGYEPWVTDGTAAGTSLLVDIVPGVSGSSPDEFVRFGSRVFFAATSAAQGRELWSSDGTAAGTTLFADLNPGAAGSTPAELTIFDGVLYFVATDATAGRELWRSDGTVAGTSLVTDIRAGAFGSSPGDLEVSGDRVYFRADDGIAGPELWKTDGTASGTAMVADINDGPLGSTPRELTASGADLYFLAFTSDHGEELWVLEGQLLCGNAVIDVGETCDDGGVIAGDGCDENCTVETCGNGALDPGEQCDDGNALDHDGCSNGCTLDCFAAAEPGCRPTLSAAGSRVSMKAGSSSSRSQLQWSWAKGEVTPKDDFGSPLSDTSYELCIYDGNGLVIDSNAPAGTTCGGKPCWTEQSQGYKYKRSAKTGRFLMSLKGGDEAGDAKISVKLRGDAFEMPSLASLATPLTVQLRNKDVCWEADFGTFETQTEDRLKARSD